MKLMCVILVAALVFQTICLPCGAQEAVTLNKNEMNSLKTGMYVEVTYLFDGKPIAANGYIQSVRKEVFTVLDISLKTIKYEDVIALRIRPEQKASDSDLKGKRVRITTRTQPEKPLEGKLIDMSVSELTLNISHGKKGIPLQEVTLFEVSTGYKRKTLNGLGYGLLTGAAITAIAAAASSPEREHEDVWFSNQQLALGLGIIVAIPVSSIIGTIIGFNSKTHIWQTVDIPQVDVSVLPIQNQGIGARISIALP